MTNHPPSPTPEQQLHTAQWYKSSYSNDQGECVETTKLPDGTIALRNSNHPHEAILYFTPTAIEAWIKGCKAEEFDDLIQ